MPVLEGAEPRRDPQLVQRGSFVEVPTPWEGKAMPGLASPVRLRGVEAPLRAAPRLGSDADAVLGESGFDVEEIAGLRSAGALG
jgi:crotonobetainyl-CoA:carnitine CoA-transferase CaiB-like acyl-CoA transferase